MCTRIKHLFLGATFAACTLNAQPSVKDVTDGMWNDPTFIKTFTGSYGFLAGYEPAISETEKETLKSLIDLIKVSPKIAIQQLEPQINNDSSAAFDFILANLHFQEGNLPKAEKFYTNAVTKHPDFRRAYKNLGLVQVQQGNFTKAVKTISKAMELGEVDGRAYGLLGYGYLSTERYYSAEAAYTQAILMQPDVSDWKVGLARCLLETQRYDDAIALFDNLLKDEPSNADYWLLQSNAFLGDKQPLMAAQNIEVVHRMDKADLGTLTLLGDIYMNNDSPDLALDAYLACIATAAEDTESKPFLRAAELLTRSGNFKQAQVMITKIRDHYATSIANADDLKLLTLEAKIARANGNDAAAVAALNSIVERDALNGDAIIELANYYADTGDIAAAINRYEQAQKIEKFERDALVAHAQALVRNNSYDEALSLLRRALQIKQDTNLQDYTQRVERAARSQS